MKYGQLFLRKIIKIVATRCQILRIKCSKFDISWESAPDPTGGPYSAPPDPLAGFKGPTSKGREAEGGGEGRDGRGGDGRGGPLLSVCCPPPWLRKLDPPLRVCCAFQHATSKIRARWRRHRWQDAGTWKTPAMSTSGNCTTTPQRSP